MIMKLTLASFDKSMLILIGVLFFFAPYNALWRNAFIYSSESPFSIGILTGHFTHWSWGHFSLNAIGLLIFWALHRSYSLPKDKRLAPPLSTTRFIAAFIAFWIASSLYLIYYSSIAFYLGFSAILYGLYVYSALRCFAYDKILFFGVLLVVFIQVQPWLIFSDSSQIIGVLVAKNTHLVTVLTAVCLVIIEHLSSFFWKK